MSGPPKRKRGLCGTALQTLKLRASYIASAVFAKAFEEPFWFFEQKRTRLLDQIDNERGGR
jgi:hypothetical protein